MANSNITWPIIVGGCHRSGTSLIRRILNAHSRIYCGPEIKFFKDWFGDYVNDPIKYARFIQSAKSIVPDEDLFSILGKAFIELHIRAANLAGKQRWADKNPENVLYFHQWEQLLGEKWYFVQVVRNPLDTLASIAEAKFDFTIPVDLDERIDFYIRYSEAGLNYYSNHKSRSYRVIYESLVSSPETEIESLMEWLGEKFEPQQMSFNNFNHQEGLEDPKIKNTTQIITDSVGRWKQRWSDIEVEHITSKTRHIWNELDTKNTYSLPALQNLSTVMPYTMQVNTNNLSNNAITICAVIAARNEKSYLQVLLPFLADQNIDVVIIDNDSSDGSTELFSTYAQKPVILVEHIPFNGYFSLSEQLDAKQKVYEKLNHDWVIHLDADEILEHGKPGLTLRDAIQEADANGYNAINFEEFVFLPEAGSDYSAKNYYKEMLQYYYFFFHDANRHQRAWKRETLFDNRISGGHVLSGENLSVSPINHIMRHYLVLSYEHAIRKYLERKFDKREIEQNWHFNRLNFTRDNLRIPKSSKYLFHLSTSASKDFNKSEPVDKHYWEWENSSTQAHAIETLSYQIKVLTTQVAEKEQVVQTLTAQVAQQEQEKQILIEQLAQSQEEVLFYAKSKSWRITRPIRKIVRFIQGKKNA